ncbi:hypothetical protein [Ferrovum myxofaciens]|uniref:hypothetical protein n=1 Tax=Ferrovum myxofaciens TaxID=416213 RepID=UPI0004E28646|nr:hypothetical protein [Ferrovum myxofaciens]MBU6993798.1 hypothetical protein [Ferrovum myxofaciens]
MTLLGVQGQSPPADCRKRSSQGRSEATPRKILHVIDDAIRAFTDLQGGMDVAVHFEQVVAGA